MTIRAALFDFDGTLADSFAAITASTNHVRRCHGLPELAEPDVRRHVGHGLAKLMAALVPGAAIESAVEEYRAHHRTVMHTHTRPMAGVAHAIPELARRGIRMGVCSNKRVEFTRQLVESLGLARYFACVLGPEDVGDRPKPDPAMLLEGLRQLGAAPAESVYVGDMDVDVQTARAAGVPVWLVSCGAAEGPAAIAAGPDRVLGHFAEILEAIPEAHA